jgi:CSLREA domain-containing protein
MSGAAIMVAMVGRASLVAAVAALALVLVPGFASAATITPNILTDEDASNTNCSLREAVALANSDSTSYNGCTASSDDDADTIVLQPGQTYALTLAGASEEANATGDLDVTAESLTIESASATRATIDGNGATTLDRVLDIDPTLSSGVGAVTLNDVNITDGDDTAGEGGGAIYQRGADLNLNRVRLFGNDGDGAGAVMRLSGLSAGMLRVQIDGNTGANGALFHEQGSVAMFESSISGQQATTAFTSGGAIFKQDITTGSLTIVNSTISGNSTTGSGGGIFVRADGGPGGPVTIRNSTIAGNTADSDAGGALVGSGGGIAGNNPAQVINVSNTIVADNTDGSVAPTDHDDCSTTLTDSDFNLVESTTGCLGLTGTDITGQDPDLNPLAANGGVTLTHSYPAGAPPDNAGNNVDPIGGTAPACLANDQRGFARDTAVSRCDIGAYERQAPVLDPIGDKTVQAGQTLAFTATATPAEPGDTLTFDGPDLPPGATLSPAGAFSWTPTAAQVGSYPGVTINVADGSLGDGEDITITVTAVPPPETGGGGTTTTPKKKCKKGRKLKKGKCVKKKRKKKK